MLKQYKLRNYHFQLILYLSLLTVVGIFVIGSAEADVQKKQILGFALGLIVMLVISLMDYSYILRFYWVYYVLALLLLALVKTPLGHSSGGSRRWIQLSSSFTFQPSEMAKILLILFFAAYFMKRSEKLNTFRVIASSLVLIAIPLGLILDQPDLSTAIVTTLIFLSLIFVAGISYKLVLIALAVVVPATILGMTYILSAASRVKDMADVDYHFIRIWAWLYPDNKLWSSYARQQQNSIMAVGSGQLWGKGLDNADATSLLNGNYISEAQTDFIFAVVGEELGFIGSLIVVVLLVVIVVECILIARKAKDLAGKLICCGMAALIGMQSALNISVATGLMPNTGIPLPFVSYGLTSLVTLFIGMGFVLNVGLQSKTTYKGDYL